jgi:hypothetical protein
METEEESAESGGYGEARRTVRKEEGKKQE